MKKAVCIQTNDRVWATRVCVNSAERVPDEDIEDHDWYLLLSGTAHKSVRDEMRRVASESSIDFTCVYDENSVGFLDDMSLYFRMFKKYDRAIRIENDVVFGSGSLNLINTMLDRFGGIACLHSRNRPHNWERCINNIEETEDGTWFFMGMDEETYEKIRGEWGKMVQQYRPPFEEDIPRNVAAVNTPIDSDFEQRRRGIVERYRPVVSRTCNFGITGLNCTKEEYKDHLLFWSDIEFDEDHEMEEQDLILV